jgi:hypothetical protein
MMTWIPIDRLIRSVRRELSDAEWEGSYVLAEALREKLAMLLYKKSIGETHEVDF